MAKRKQHTAIVSQLEPDYGVLVTGISDLLSQARRMSVRSTNCILTATYWEIGRRIVEFEQGGKARAEYGEGLLKRLGMDLIAQHGRGFSWRNLFRMRGFYLAWEILPTPSAIFEARVRQPHSHGANMPEICQTVSGASAPDAGGALGGQETGKRQTPSAKSRTRQILPTLSAEFNSEEANLVSASIGNTPLGASGGRLPSNVERNSFRSCPAIRAIPFAFPSQHHHPRDQKSENRTE
jgi:hypothetical protein